jgi:hypothetical protein
MAAELPTLEQATERELAELVLDTLLAVNPVRFRSVYCGKTQLVIRTRAGGANRYFYDNRELWKHPLFLSDEDVKDDRTYQLLSFRWPENVSKDIKVVLQRRSLRPPEGVDFDAQDYYRDERSDDEWSDEEDTVRTVQEDYLRYYRSLPLHPNEWSLGLPNE